MSKIALVTGLNGERFEALLSHRSLVIERIISSADITPTDYVQSQDEWVVLFQGEATLEVRARLSSCVPATTCSCPPARRIWSGVSPTAHSGWPCTSIRNRRAAKIAPNLFLARSRCARRLLPTGALHDRDQNAKPCRCSRHIRLAGIVGLSGNARLYRAARHPADHPPGRVVAGGCRQWRGHRCHFAAFHSATGVERRYLSHQLSVRIGASARSRRRRAAGRARGKPGAPARL